MCVAAAAFLSLACQALAAWPHDYDPRYVEAVENTSGTVPNDIVRRSENLACLGDSRMEWSGDRLVMTMLTDFAGYDRTYADSRYRPEVWVAPVGETAAFFQAWAGQPGSLEARYRQYMGMPLSHSDDRIVEVLIHPDMLFRPAEDTRIDSPSLGPGRDTTQYEKAAELYPTFDQWWANQNHTYDPTSNPPYPWTRLGYTYDWGGSPDQIVGATEFIVKRWGTGSTWLRDGAGNWYQAAFNVLGAGYALSVHAVVPTTAYPYYVRSGPDVGNFLVTGPCTTIWAGDRFTPVGSTTPLVDITEDAVVSHGILIDDGAAGRTFQLTNRGTILGGLYGPDKTVRAHTLEFRSATCFDNLGLVDAPSVALRGQDARGPLVVRNWGALLAGQDAALLGDFDDTFFNAGTVLGNVDMAGGDDTVLLAAGDLHGSLDGGSHLSADRFLVQAEGPVCVTGDIRGFEQVVVSGNAPFHLDGTLAGDVLLGASEGYAPGVLGGNFTIDGAVATQAGARVAPGNSIGTGQVTGDYTQAAGAVLDVETARTVDNRLLSDSLEVGGTASLADGAVVRVARDPSQGALPLHSGDSFSILQAGDLQMAVPPQCLSDSAVLDFRCDGSDDDLLLVVADVRGWAQVATTGRSRAIAAAMDADLAAADGPYAQLLAEMQFADADAINQALDAIRPDAYQAFAHAARLATWSMHEQLAESTVAGCETGAAEPDPSVSTGAGAAAHRPGETRLALEPFGLFQYQAASPTTIGYAAQSAGFLLEANRQLSDQLAVGAVFGYADLGVDLRGEAGYGDLKLYRIGPYAQWQTDGWRLHGAATVGQHHHETRRSAAPLGSHTAIYSATDGSLYFDLRRPGTGPGWSLVPLASLQYTFGRRQEVAESLPGPTAMTLSPWQSDSLHMRLGAGLGRTFGQQHARLRTEILAGWAHEFLADQSPTGRFTGGGSPFYLPGDVFLKDAGFVRGALTVCAPGPWDISAAYDGLWGTETVAHGASLSVGRRF
ncbi:MAG: autotransporter outer membrane beta-barrel domain-containing protein [Thermoguttaceae bacterium]